MSNYPYIQTIRYMGNKGKLLNELIPVIESLTEPGDIVCDIMAGTNSVSYALKSRNRVVTNDIQYYSYVISKCLLDNYTIPSLEEAHNDLDENYKLNLTKKYYSFFVDQYTDTYFAEWQCLDIDSFRYAIEQISDDSKKYFYLTVLMSVMCKAQSTPGHFAQYMNKDHKRILPLRRLSIYELFYDKISDFKDFVISHYENYHYNLDYKILFEEEVMDSVKCFYLDSPYTADQYSRFYHVLETVCKYDNPILEHKAKYRNDRVQSAFSYKNKVAGEFEYIISFCKSKNTPLVISYSNRGVIPVEEIVKIANKYYDFVIVKNIDFEHSSQGKGTIDIQEVIITLK